MTQEGWYAIKTIERKKFNPTLFFSSFLWPSLSFIVFTLLLFFFFSLWFFFLSFSSFYLSLPSMRFFLHFFGQFLSKNILCTHFCFLLFCFVIFFFFWLFQPLRLNILIPTFILFKFFFNVSTPLRIPSRYKFKQSQCIHHCYIIKEISLGFWDTNGSLNLGQTTRPSDCQQLTKVRTCRIVDFAIPADHMVKLKENEKRDKYLNLARELKKLWNMRPPEKDTNNVYRDDDLLETWWL